MKAAYYLLKEHWIRVSYNSKGITGLCWVSLPDPLNEPTQMTNRVIREIKAYLNRKRKSFSVPLCPSGTAFQKKVWNAVMKIPYGKTKTFQQLAEELGTSARAVGSAVSRNPIMLLIPTHRVVGTSGMAPSYGGRVDHKQNLLDLESGRTTTQTA